MNKYTNATKTVAKDNDKKIPDHNKLNETKKTLVYPDYIFEREKEFDAFRSIN